MRDGLMPPRYVLAAAAITVSTLLSGAQAADITWDNGATNNLWTSGANWNPGNVVPTNVDTAIIGGTTPAAIDAAGAATIDALRLTRTVTLNNGPIAMDAIANQAGSAGILSFSGGSSTINSNLSFTGTSTTGNVTVFRAETVGTNTINGTVTATSNLGAAGSSFVDFSGAIGVGSVATTIFNGGISYTRTTGNTELTLNRGTVELNAANTWNTGGASLRAVTQVNTGTGTLRLGHANALGSTSFSMGSFDGGVSGTHTTQVLQTGTNTIPNNVLLRNSSAVNILGADIASGTATYSGGITLQNVTTGGTAGQLIFKSVQSGGTVAMSGLIANGGTGTVLRNLTIGQASTGIGTVALTRAAGNTYTGSTTVAAGTLRVSNTSGSATGTGAVSVASGATLGGTGIIGGATSIVGTLAPGASAGTLTIGAGGLTLDPAAVLSYELNASDMTVGGGINDLTVVGGAFTLDGTLNVASASPLGQGTWRLFNYSGTLTDNGLALGTLSLADNGTASINTATPGQVNLVVAVPEPTSLAVLALGGIALLRRRRSN